MIDQGRTGDDTIGLAECAQRLGVPYQEAHRQLLIGRLNGAKRGGRWFITRESLDRYHRERQAQLPTSEAAAQVRSSELEVVGGDEG